MKIYKLSQYINNDWDTYDSIIVIAKNEEEAKNITPLSYIEFDDNYNNGWIYNKYNKDDISVEYLGNAKKGLKRGVLLTSFNAG